MTCWPRRRIVPADAADPVQVRRFGVGLYTGQHPDGDRSRRSYQDLTALAAAAEQAGFDSFWVTEHHGLPDGYLPSPLTALAAVATATRSIQLGTGLALAPLHHPLRLAEDAVVVDQLSAGRLVLGLGLGYAAEEYRTFGVDPSTRGARLDELVSMLRQAWTGEPFSCRGPTIEFDRARVTPKPWREEGIPIWLGGYAQRAVRRAGQLADAHLVGKGAPDVIAAASDVLRTVRSPDDPGFVRAVNLASVLDEPDGGAGSARRAFARQQQIYERIQAGRDVYGGLVADPSGAQGLAGGSIDSDIQVSGDTDQVVARLRGVLDGLRGWANVHLVLRLLFPEPDLDVQLARLAAFGERVLPRLRDDTVGRQHR
ncbi:MAG: TIGR03619 family F420-dependent LLM class oxidoreductase [Pseudonocardiaceae bacterium]|nr:TIGR03619 family F420-dependent LLM class oxidoreductase [Pseudonocardiaceae bacterium]